MQRSGIAPVKPPPRGRKFVGWVWSEATTHHHTRTSFTFGQMGCCANPPYTIGIPTGLIAPPFRVGMQLVGWVWSKATTHHHIRATFTFGQVGCCANPPYTIDIPTGLIVPPFRVGMQTHLPTVIAHPCRPETRHCGQAPPIIVGWRSEQ